jgi:hypothetical protein
LLNNLLDAHPELVVLPGEGTYFTSFRYAACARPSTERVDRFVADWIARLVDPNFQPHFNLGRSGPAGNPSVHFARRLLGWHQRLVAEWPARAQFGLLLSLIASFGAVVNPSGVHHYWVEKTPLNERYVERLATAFSDAKFVQLVREPRSTFTSLLEMYHRDTISEIDLLEAARSIDKSFQRAARNMRRFSVRYLVVRYEDLVANTEREMEHVRAFLAISPSASLTTPTVLGTPVRSNSSFVRGPAGAIRVRHAGRSLSSTEASIIDAFTASSAAPFGYHIEAPSILKRMPLFLRGNLCHAVRHARARLREVGGTFS